MSSSISEFRTRVLSRGRELYREMPWRNVDDAYAVLVSEVMLQQTQVARVLTRWPAFMEIFPTVDALAFAATSDVLEAWQGLGYNRRALNLKRACETVSERFAGRFPETAAELESLPGIGPATAAGVVAFAYDRPAVYVETNVRAVFIHEFFPDRVRVPDAEIIPLVREACPETGVREWYYALLDVGADLKAGLGKAADPSRRSAAYAKQSVFEGSHRQKRARLVRIVLAEPGIAEEDAYAALAAAEVADGRREPPVAECRALAEELSREGFFTLENGSLNP